MKKMYLYGLIVLVIVVLVLLLGQMGYIPGLKLF
jgi:hypothetical protein